MARLDTANTLINRLMPEIGLETTPDPVASSDTTFVQMVALLSAAGRELVELFDWTVLRKEWEFTTDSGTDTGVYDLPDDFSRFINQTAWDQTNRVMLGGPLSPQNWSYLEGRDLATSSIYASYRMAEHKMEIFPQPVPDALDLRFEYISRNWVLEADGTTYRDDIGAGSDTIRLDPLVVLKFLKCKWREAKGLDPSTARLEFENIINARLGRDTGAPVLNVGRGGGGIPYLNSRFSVPDTGYGV